MRGLFVAGVVLCAACGDKDKVNRLPDAPGIAIRVDPPALSFTIVNGAAITQAYTASFVEPDGTERRSACRSSRCNRAIALQPQLGWQQHRRLSLDRLSPGREPDRRKPPRRQLACAPPASCPDDRYIAQWTQSVVLE